MAFAGLKRFPEAYDRDIIETLGNISGIQMTHKRGSGRAPTRFPGPNPVSMERADFYKFQHQPYHMTEKTDGVRMALLACDIQGKHVVALFDRTLTPYIFTIHKMPRALYQGTLFDGELVYDTLEGAWTYLIFDAINVAGVPVFQFPFTERMAAVASSLIFYEPTLGKDCGLMRLKKFIPLTADLGLFNAHVADVQKRYATDGVIFMPESDRVVYGRHDNLMKLKQKHSLDFLSKNGKLMIYDETTRRNKAVGVPVGPNAHLATADGVVVECVLDASASIDKPDKWCVLAIRHDKDKSNNKFTFDKTLVNMREALTLEMVVAEIFQQAPARWSDME